jgi:hypothetical protein
VYWNVKVAAKGRAMGIGGYEASPEYSLARFCPVSGTAGREEFGLESLWRLKSINAPPMQLIARKVVDTITANYSFTMTWSAATPCASRQESDARADRIGW